jgi:hypothetical protein
MNMLQISALPTASELRFRMVTTCNSHWGSSGFDTVMYGGGGSVNEYRSEFGLEPGLIRFDYNH